MLNHEPAEGEWREQFLARQAQLEDQLRYDRERLAAAVEAGAYVEYGPHNVHVEDTVRRGWARDVVVEVNRVTVKICISDNWTPKCRSPTSPKSSTRTDARVAPTRSGWKPHPRRSAPMTLNSHNETEPSPDGPGRRRRRGKRGAVRAISEVRVAAVDTVVMTAKEYRDAVAALGAVIAR